MSSVIRILLTGFIMLASTAASAAYIGGTMTLTGDYTPTASDDNDLTTVTAITLDTVGTNGTATDSFTTTINFGTPDESGPFTTASLTAFTEISNFLTFAGWQLDLKTLTVEADSTAGFLHLSGTGLLSGNAFDETGATWSFSAHNAEIYSMTVTAAVVPVPAAVWLFGSGLIGLVAVARRKT